MRLATALALTVGCQLAAAGCGLGDGTGTLAGTLFLSGCTHEADYGIGGAPAGYDMKPTYFVADPINALASSKPLHPVNKLILRVQPSGNRTDESDLLFINIADVAQVAASMGSSIAIGATTNVRASLTLNQTCPRAEVQPELDGTMTWTSFGAANAEDGVQFGDRLAATFSFDVVDRRQIAIGGIGGVPTTPAAAGHVDGSFDFTVRQGKAAQAY
ncbi:MAG: hypothetical protein JWN44_364 [Myxococcales bacterium]|nr:hypothetical protein [Myxococcales bacterium]